MRMAKQKKGYLDRAMADYNQILPSIQVLTFCVGLGNVSRKITIKSGGLSARLGVCEDSEGNGDATTR
jgi:hypothetical protein